MDSEYKITTLLIYLFQTIGSETISNHMHCTGSHQIQIPIVSMSPKYQHVVSSLGSEE